MKGWQLARFLLRDWSARLAFRGVWSIDDFFLSKTASLRLPAAIVINTDTSDGPGIHWVAAYIDPWQRGWYFDSYGFPPPPILVYFLNARTIYWTFSDTTLQSVTSTTCGYFCLYFLYHKTRGKTLSQIIGFFDTTRLKSNDSKLKAWYRQQILHHGRGGGYSS